MEKLLREKEKTKNSNRLKIYSFNTMAPATIYLVGSIDGSQYITSLACLAGLLFSRVLSIWVPESTNTHCIFTRSSNILTGGYMDYAEHFTHRSSCSTASLINAVHVRFGESRPCF